MTDSRNLELTKRLASQLESVDGWLFPAEAAMLFTKAKAAASRGRRPTLVEIGSYMGRSTIALGLGLQAGGGGRLVSIDPADMVENQFETLQANVKRAGVDDVVHFLRMLSHDARGHIEDATVSVLFVDGSHEYSNVMQDIHDWTSALEPGATVAFNDPFWPGVSQALLETAGASGSAFRNPRWVMQTVVVDYRPDARWTFGDSVRRIRLRSYLRLGRRWRASHWRLVSNERVPVWAKRLQLKIATRAFKVVLPYRIG